MKRILIGVSDLDDMINGNYYYVDKTPLIKDVYELAGKIKLITLPRKLGSR